ncbi:hypothetical protein J2797_004791 [Paraburkholderia terricola]|nr:hypothetical protein [Paraburkholderia terricola]
MTGPIDSLDFSTQSASLDESENFVSTHESVQPSLARLLLCK